MSWIDAIILLVMSVSNSTNNVKLVVSLLLFYASLKAEPTQHMMLDCNSVVDLLV